MTNSTGGLPAHSVLVVDYISSYCSSERNLPPFDAVLVMLDNLC